MRNNKISVIKVEAFLRLFAFCALFVSAIVVVLDSQTKVVFGFFKQKATYKLATIARVYVYVHFICAGYSLLQFVRCMAFINNKEDQLTLSHRLQKWSYFSIDQVVVYMVFATNCAISEMAFLVLTGSEVFQWLKLCSKFTRFCVQVGSAIFCGFVAFSLLLLISCISAFNLFRWYSPNFMCLKPKKVGALHS
ncbi:hypothetical protein vseg_018499 [Gypsophila vaccaria]